MFYAEPDAEGRRILILELVSSGNLRGRLFSVAANKDWLTLGRMRDRYSVAFLENGAFGIGSPNLSRVVQLKALEELVAMAWSGLSVDCRTEADYRSSPCWPEHAWHGDRTGR